MIGAVESIKAIMLGKLWQSTRWRTWEEFILYQAVRYCIWGDRRLFNESEIMW